MTKERLGTAERKLPPLTIGQAIDQYKTSEDFSRRSASTQEAYSSDLSFFANFCHQSAIFDLANLKPHNIADLIDEMRPKFAPKTVGRRVTSVRGFCNWAVAEGKLAEDFLENLPEVSTPKSAQVFQALTPEEERALIEETRKRKSSRDSALVTIGLKTGAKPNEIRQLDLSDINFLGDGKTVVRFRSQTKQKERIVIINSEVSPPVQSLVEERKRGSGSYLFADDHVHKRLTRQGMWLVLKRYEKEIGITLNPTVLRNTCAKNFKGNHLEFAIMLGIESSTAARLLKLYRAERD